MERRTAVATALASGTTLAVTTFALLAVGAVSILGLGITGAADTEASLVIIRQVQPIEDDIVVSPAPAPDPVGVPVGVDTTMMPAASESPTAGSDTGGGARPPASTGSIAPAPSATRPIAVPVVTMSAPTTPSATNPPAAAPPMTSPPPAPTTDRSDDDDHISTLPATTVPSGSTAPVTTTATTTATASRPPGVPADWPPDRPILPMPPNCKKPQLEDSGVWNCDT